MNFGNCIKSIWRIFITAFLLAALTACGGEKLDGTSMANYEASKDRIMQGMSSAEMQEFKGNLKKAQSFVANEISAANRGEAVAAALTNPAAFTEKVIERLHGKTVSDVAEMAKEWDALARRQEIDSLKSKIDKGYESLVLYNQMTQAFSLINLENVRLSPKPERGYVVLHGSIINKSEISFGKAVFDLPFWSRADGSPYVFRAEFSPELNPGERRDVDSEIFIIDENGPPVSGEAYAKSIFPRSLVSCNESLHRSVRCLAEVDKEYFSSSFSMLENDIRKTEGRLMEIGVNYQSPVKEKLKKLTAVSNIDVQKEINATDASLVAIPENSSADGEEYEQEYPDGLSPDAWHDFVEGKYDWLNNQKVPDAEKKAFVKFYVADPGLFSQLSRHMQEVADKYSD